jgi:hypothetical protein
MKFVGPGRAVLPRRPTYPVAHRARRKRISNPQLHILAWAERTLVTLFDYDRSLRLVTPQCVTGFLGGGAPPPYHDETKTCVICGQPLIDSTIKRFNRSTN